VNARRPVEADHPVLQRFVAEARSRLDRAVLVGSDRFPTRASARKACDRGEVAVNGVVSESCRWVEPGDEVAVLESLGRPLRPLLRRLGVAYEDDRLAIVVKPPGLVTLGPRGRTLQRALPSNLRPSPLPDALVSPRPVHRLDARTGGLVVVAKTRSAHAELGRAFAEHRVHKRYRALVIGALEGEGTCEAEVGGRAARSRWASVRVSRALRTDWVTTVDLFPETGRTHQLRAHLAGLGHPILGDEVYGAPGRTLVGKGLYLFAVELALPGGPRIEVPEPAKFESFRAREDKRWRRWHDA
jgi:23S rRNA-/tRNA-specific pseudouridylate synthase